MTTLSPVPVPGLDHLEVVPGQPLGVSGRGQTDLLRDQLRAIDAWNVARRARLRAEEAAASSAHSREVRMDLARRMDVIQRQHQALIERADEHLRLAGRLLRGRAPLRAVVVHRNEWYMDKVIAGLQAGGVTVVGRLENGADAVGVVVAEQPDLLLVEDKLPMLNGDEVLRQALAFAPGTLAAAQVSKDDGLAALLEAGARTAFTRRVPPADVARELCQLVRA